MTIAGLIALAVWQLMPRFRTLPAMLGLTATSLPKAEAALNGFILANGRLPCPDTTGGGGEDCSGCDASALGWLCRSTAAKPLSEVAAAALLFVRWMIMPCSFVQLITRSKKGTFFEMSAQATEAAA